MFSDPCTIGTAVFSAPCTSGTAVFSAPCTSGTAYQCYASSCFQQRSGEQLQTHLCGSTTSDQSLKVRCRFARLSTKGSLTDEAGVDKSASCRADAEDNFLLQADAGASDLQAADVGLAISQELIGC